jgi:hypothetical protein
MNHALLTADQHALLTYVVTEIDKFGPDDALREEYVDAKEALLRLYAAGFSPDSASDYIGLKYRVDVENDAAAAMYIVSRRRMTIDFEEYWGHVTVKFWEDDMDWIDVDMTEHDSRQENVAAVLFAVSLATEAWLDRQVFRLVLCDDATQANEAWLLTND